MSDAVSLRRRPPHFKELIMDTPYYVASLKGSGWFSRSGLFDSRREEAREFGLDEAIGICQRFKEAGHALVPVRKSDMERI